MYGIGEEGLGSAADDRRKALAYQLKAYLLFFDQVMANYLAQLSQVKDLFSTDPTVESTYFQQMVDTFADYNKIYKTTDANKSRPEDKPVFIDRRNRFLDHLIVRFAEQCHDYVYTMYSTFGLAPEEMFDYKCKFLNAYPVISSERSLAYNYSLKEGTDLWNTENISGLEKRLARLLGINNSTRRDLCGTAYEMIEEVYRASEGDFRFRIGKKDDGKILLDSIDLYDTPERARTEMNRAISVASLSAGFELSGSKKGKYSFNVVDKTGGRIATRNQYFVTEAERNDAINEVMTYFQANYTDDSQEGMYLIENILLRPEQSGDPFLPVCADCVETDPYSYRIHIILPAYGKRFSNREFRRFAEEVIREETPAHILPKICWISQEDMAELEKQYHEWIKLKAGKGTVTTADRTLILNNFIDIMTKAYPIPGLGGRTIRLSGL